jgi:hypothetical protein
MTLKTRATIHDLYGVDGKAEIVNGAVVHMPPAGALPGYGGPEVPWRPGSRRQQGVPRPLATPRIIQS